MRMHGLFAERERNNMPHWLDNHSGSPWSSCWWGCLGWWCRIFPGITVIWMAALGYGVVDRFYHAGLGAVHA